jgi:hypothetical protein
VEIPNRVERHPLPAQQVDDGYAKSWLAKKARHKGEGTADFPAGLAFLLTTLACLNNLRGLRRNPTTFQWKQING